MRKAALLAPLLVILCGTAASAANVVHLATLEWPPFTSERLAEYGASTAVAKAAFAAMGYTLEVTFYPWQRTLYHAAHNKKYSGYFPEYDAKDRAGEFLFSEPIGESPLGFVELVEKPVSWSTLSDLEHLRIGTVRGYVNTADFDLKAGRGELRIDPVTDDVTNLRKLLLKRIDIAVIDKYVYHYYMSTTEALAAGRARVQFNKKILENKKLYVCFRNDEHGKHLVRVFNEGLKRIDYRAIQEQHVGASLPPER